MAEQHRVENVLVVGAGVSGLTTALELARVREDGEPRYQVQVVAERPADKTVSVIAGALWEFPPAVCGQHGNQLSIMRSKRWSVESYKEFRKLAPNAGVHMVTSNFYFGIKIEDDWLERTKMRELQKLSEEEEIEGFRRLTQEEIKKVPASFQVKDGYQLRVPAVDTPLYTRWLRDRLDECENVTVTYGKRITDRLVPQSAKIRQDWGVDAIVNCTGMGAAELAGSCMVPLRGALVRVPMSRWPKDKRPKTAYAISKTAHQQDMVFIVPRETHLMLGGLVEPSEYDTHIGKDYTPVKDMFDRCKRFAPDLLQGIELGDEDVDVVAGLRPYRVENVCVEKEYGFNIVHNFGHGGSGFSLSYGCAREAIGLLDSMEGASFRVVDLKPAALHHHADTYAKLGTPDFTTVPLDGQEVSVEHPVYA
ncbi:FAD-dependent oxidoreductase [Streptomyces litmocidini]|uniref:FAD-dependent oxidoreductase n=1 Tax=Streptomyces TaxID=1883 RepID=UPI000F45FE3D|nr:FAD-dependent oxidoreductase [Streptomyces sp. PanSC19]ROQ26217.1 D-amino-acid:oxygen oxidoreductase (deaminating) [Streptomyces sp. PanSC19]